MDAHVCDRPRPIILKLSLTMLLLLTHYALILLFLTVRICLQIYHLGHVNDHSFKVIVLLEYFNPFHDMAI